MTAKMSAFKAINIESESEPDEEIDDTQEIQIEEALKLYQIALKYHSEGPVSFDAAAKAYEDLFKSEIFAYPEALSDLRRHETYAIDAEDEPLEDSEAELQTQSPNTNEQAPNTLPQIIHLAYKNYGQSLLDALEDKYKKGSDQKPTNRQLLAEVTASLRSFAEAISKDEADVDLWRKISILGEIIVSRRLTRLSLEAVLGRSTLRKAGLQLLPGPEEWYAEEKQRDLIENIGDDLALKGTSSSTAHRLLKPLLAKFRPYSGIPHVSGALETADATLPFAENTASQLIKLQKLGWTDLGDAIIDCIVKYSDSPRCTISPRILVASADGSTLDSFDMDVDESRTLGEPITITELEANNAYSVDVETDDINAGLLNQPELSEVAAKLATPMARKRSTDSAGLPEAAEGGRSRSKRIRARESIADNAHAGDPTATDTVRESEYLQQLYIEADSILFETIGGTLDKIGLSGIGQVDDIRKTVEVECEEIIKNTEGQSQNTDDLALVDLNNILHNCTEDLAQRLIQRGMIKQMSDVAHSAHIQAPNVLTSSSGVESSTTKDLFKGAYLKHLYQEINSKSMVVDEVSWAFLIRLLGHQNLFALKTDLSTASTASYLTDHWSSDLKSDVLKMLFYINDYIYFRVDQSIKSLEKSMLSCRDQNSTYFLTDEDHALIELVQALFELHLDLLTADVQVSSEILAGTDILKGHYVNRWAILCQTALAFYLTSIEGSGFEELVFRFVWAFAFYLKASGDISDRQMILFLQELKNIITTAQTLSLKLPNSTFMPELSLEAINEEVTVLSLKDFFMKIYEDPDLRDPLSLIETLEPVLEYSTHSSDSSRISLNPDEKLDTSTGDAKDSVSEAQELLKTEGASIQEASDYVQKSKVLLRLSLWHRLGEAYEAIEFIPKTVACRFRILELLCQELKGNKYSELPESQRHESLIDWLGVMDQQITDILNILKKEPQLAFDFIDEVLLTSALDNIVIIIRLLYVCMVYDDRERLKSPQGSSFPQLSASLSAKVKTFIQDMRVRIWILFYYLLQEANDQYREAFENFEEDKLNYIRAIHYAMSVRGHCKQSKMAFLRFAKNELLSLAATEEVDLELSQVLYDLYGLKSFTNPIDCIDHGTSTETIDKKVALSILDFILRQIRKVNIKELHRTELKASIDRVNMAIGRQKSHDSLIRNRKLYNAYLKSIINPLDLYRCLDGSGALSTVPISPHLAPIASRGWYFIMGNLSINKYRSQKRLTSGPTEELNAAITFFAQDIEYCANNWESWYRVAQVYDFQIEELVLWSAEKMNSNSNELVNFQRSAIHCYILAVACAVRSSDQSGNCKSTIAEMYFDFGMRIYASSRPPFSMEAFIIKDNEQRYISGSTTFKARPFKELHRYTAWKFAAALFTRAIALERESWMSYYMLGKCLWKMHTSGAEDPVGKQVPTAESVVQAFLNAIECLPVKKEKNREPIIEPHYKLASLMHKLVQRRELEPYEAYQTLQASTYASKVPSVNDMGDWQEYILQVLKVLRTVDKSNWHHRMIARAAHVLLEDEANGNAGAIAAKHELSQHIFTKTMTVQVWKPEYERPGRHFVYTSRYTLLFIQLLSETADRVNFELLARKVRKKAHDFYKHTIVWTELCTHYLKVLRKCGDIPELNEENVFRSINYDEFLIRASKLEVWCHSSKEGSPLLEILREAVDLKKLNAGLAKLPSMDDLIGDIYAALFAANAPVSDHHQSLLPASQDFADNLTKANGTNTALSMNGPAPEEVDHHQALLAPKSAVPVIEQQSRARAKGIGRREVQRRAEAAATKPANPAIPLRPPAQPVPEKNQVQVVIETKATGELNGSGDATGPVGVESSAPGSVHDSADDESELSDVEEVIERPLFPGLVNRAKEESDLQKN